ncbi:AAA ATPase domain-containing protein [Cavenderia fasciculata]|uniref:Peroxisomal ATPase PEX6 n=1 Tax=Cavenderia fasciculata TaxID=261658 RepID=F4PZN8_CACFS|nr:AAA ATPase domain-containing protein [Cavenderia fasciculata]EGG18802.1 AAA ATPase domain-containing protein [Cavenderia fasciculata]|eukprot:XP_004357264.1 AAA ATPase domain-containing protein [Cavenderia fasciculata]
MTNQSSSWHRIRVISDDRYLQLYPSTTSLCCGTLIMPSNDNCDDETTTKFRLHNQYHMFLYKLDHVNTFRINNNIKNNNSNSSNSNNNSYLQYHQGSKELLVSFHLLNNQQQKQQQQQQNDTSSSSSSSSSLSKTIILVSITFSRQFGLMDDDIVHSRLVPIQSVSLQRVILLSKDLQSFESVTIPQDKQQQSVIKKYQANQQFKSFVAENGITFIQSSNISMDAQSSFTVLECYPMLQGCINDSTTLIIVAPDSIHQQQHQHQPFVKSIPSTTSLLSTNGNNNLRISNFIIHPLSTPVPTVPTPISSSSLFHFTPNSNRTLSNNIVQSRIMTTIPHEIDIRLIDQNYDYMNDCCVTLTTLKQLGLFHGSFIKLNNTRLNQQIVVRVYSIIPIGLGSKLIDTLSLQDGILYLPPIQSFNLGNGKGEEENESFELEISILKNNKQQQDKLDNNNNLYNIFPIANKIKISRINTPESNGYASYTNQLVQYFNNSSASDIIRVMKQGDIFSINENDNNNNGGQLIFFKVEQIQSPTNNTTTQTIGPPETELFIIDYRKCTVIQEGSCNSFLPNNIKSFSDRLHHPESSVIAYNDEFLKLQNIISTFTTSTIVENQSNQSNLNLLDIDYNCSILIKGLKGIGKKTMIKQLADRLGTSTITIDCFELFSFNEKEKEDNLKNALIAASDNVPCIVILEHFDVLEQSPSTSLLEKKESNITSILKDTIQLINDKFSTIQQNQNNNQNNNSLIIIGTVETTDEMSGKLRGWFKYEIELLSPDENQRKILLKSIFRNIPLNNSVSISNIAMRTASFLPLNLHQLRERSAMAALKRVFQSLTDKSINAQDICSCGVVVGSDDISDALADMQGYQSSSIGAPKIPNVKWDDVGGLANVKSEIMDTIQLPLENPHLFASGIGKRSGILLYGPPGTGKTLMAKAIATECSLNFLSVKGPELINMYIGESEKNIRDIFNRARQAKPCVIFFDELDSLAPARGAGADSGGVMDRVVSQLLAELDGMQGASDVFIIGATNRPDLLDPALMIPGRLDRLLYLGISSDKESQLKIVQALTRKFHLDDDVDLHAIVAKCPFNLTGSDFYALCSDSLANSIKDKINQLEDQRKSRRKEFGSIGEDEFIEQLQKQQKQVIVKQKHFLEAVDNLVPSVSQDELQYYHKVQKQFSK